MVDGTKAYISTSEPGNLIVFDLATRQWWAVTLLPKPLYATTQLAIAPSYIFLASNMTDSLLRVGLSAIRTSRHTDALNNVIQSSFT